MWNERNIPETFSVEILYLKIEFSAFGLAEIDGNFPDVSEKTEIFLWLFALEKI
eukprot:TRINITY_DN11672_c0_g1_i1.p4 TRINITY_DN11672_c0_g1~~TRINITY_DN11672_c0_g1_i1.p4  ORF type:complete len:54 (+),score=13.00 TRINITY_DN11672_c0_g1_i1:53-214(+)